MDVLVTGADERQGLAVVRALGATGLSVVAAGLKPKNLGGRSRYAAATCAYPSPLTDKEGFIAAILESVSRYRVKVVMPVVESTLIAVDEHRSVLEPHARLAIPSSAALSHALDKKKTYDLAASLGIDVPRTAYPGTYEEAREFAQEVGFPLIIKPRAYGSYRGVKGGFNFKIRYLQNKAAFAREMQAFEADGLFPMLQEYCPGTCVPQSLLCDRGKPIGIYQHRRGRDYPLSGGVASVVISEAVDPFLRQWTEALMGTLNWHGIAQVEYRVDQESGRKVLFEINGRFWAPVSAAIQLGLNFPYALHELVTKDSATPMPDDYPAGKRFRYLRGDLIAIESYLLGETKADVAPLPGKWQVVWDMIKDFRPGVASDVFSWKDPVPSFFESGNLLVRYGLGAAYELVRALFRGIQKRIG